MISLNHDGFVAISDDGVVPDCLHIEPPSSTIAHPCQLGGYYGIIRRMKKTSPTLPRVYPWLLVIGGTIGFLASFILSIDKFKLLENPHFHPLCSINPVISCLSVMSTPQAAAFGFPNMFLGIAGFAMVVTVGMAMLAGGTFKPWFWRLFNLGPLFGVGFIHWLFFESVYRINALCIYCMIVWSMIIPLFLYATLYNLRQGHLPTPKALKGVVNLLEANHGFILVLWYIVIAFLIFKHFWYYFGTFF
jgi:uncharacterized membrane protein